MKRVVSLILALSMVLSMFTMSFAATGLKDIEGTKYEAAVEALIELGIVNGYPDGTYLPDNVVTRAELAKLLVVAYGLEPAAEASKGVTPFSDIESNHWASGYINVSADYKFVNGYPEGTFKGDATVTYAEAITMCLRVLGYTSEIDSKGTWPTNYIAKAQDLQLMKDIDFSSYNDGAKRGDVALLIWNMLRTDMWEIVGESEGDGLESRPNREMLNVKFTDYMYNDEAIFEGFEIEADSKTDAAKVVVTIDGVEYDYAENDFYTYVPGTEVEVLVNKEDKVLLTMVPNGEDRLVSGTKEEMVDADYDALNGGLFEYAYGILKNRDVASNTQLVASSIYVDKVEVSNKGKVTLTSNKAATVSFTASECQSELFLRDDERVAIEDIETGEILTKVTVTSTDGEITTSEVFYVIGVEEVEGELTKYVIDTYDDGVEYHTITVDGEEYFIGAAADDEGYGATMFVEDPSKTKVTPQQFAGNYGEKMKGEDVVLILDPVFGKVVRIEFDGKIDAGGETGNWKFFGIAGDVTTDYEIELMDTTGEVDTYTFVNKTVARQYFNYDGRLEGSFVAVELNDENAISAIRVIGSYSGEEVVIGDLSDIVYGDLETNANEYYTLEEVTGTFDEENNTFNGGVVTSSTVVARVVFDDNGTVKTSDDEWYVEFAEDALDELSNVSKDGEQAVIIKDMDDKLERIGVVVLFTEKSDKSDAQVGIVESLKANKLDKDKQDVTFEDGTVLTTEDGVTISDDTTVVVYKVKTNSKDEEFISVIYELSEAELNLATETGKLVVENDGLVVKYDGEDTSIDYGAKANRDKYEDDYVMVSVSVTLDKDDQYKVSTVDIIDYDELTFAIDDRVIIDDTAEVFIVITGMGERTGASTGDTDEPSEETGTESGEGSTTTEPGTESGESSTTTEPGTESGETDTPVVEDVKVTAITLTAKDNVTTVTAGETLQLFAGIEPDGAALTTLTWSSSNDTYATVSAEGVVTGLEAGVGQTIKITATATDGSEVYGTIELTITPATTA